VRLGLLLPTFRHTPSTALEAAADAEALGLDGVFAYDHLWPMGSPERPAIAPFEILATVAVRHRSLVVGPLVARVGLVSDDVLLGQLRALRVVAGGRCIAALGTGDHKSREENLAYGIDFALPDERRAAMRSIAAALIDDGVEVWIGGGAPATREIAVELGCTLNLWDATPGEVADAAARSEVCWSGPMPVADGAPDVLAVARLARGLEGAGATWAVFGAPARAHAVAALRDELGRAAAL